MCDEQPDVLIVGSNLVGLSMALFLAWHDIRCMLVDRWPGQAAPEHTMPIDAHTFDLFRSVGLSDALRAICAEEAAALTCSSTALMRLVAGYLGGAPAALCLDSRLLAFGQDSHGVRARICSRASGTERIVAARYLVLAEAPLGAAPGASGAAAVRQADGRVFWAGDAAPARARTAQSSLQLGLHDAYNLAWKLAFVLREQAHPALLHSYDAERRMFGDTLACAPEHSGGAQAGAAMIPDTNERPGRPGTRAPQVALERHGRPISTGDFMGSDFVLFAGADGADWRAAALRAANRLMIGMIARQIGPDGDICDPHGRWAPAYGVTSRGAALVRPDGIVAWRSATAAPDPEQAISSALLRVLGRETVYDCSLAIG